MIIDSSAIVALLRNEPEAMRIFHALKTLSRPGARFMTAPNLLETSIVMYAYKGSSILPDVYTLVTRLGIHITAADRQLTDIATDAYVRFGKKTGHPAQLNFGDCFSYALAKKRKLPLLFKGNDFGHTDIGIVPY